MQSLPVRLQPGQDLRQGLEECLRDAQLGGAFVVSGIGSLSDPRLRFAGSPEDTVLHGPFEILGLSGTVTEGGSHLHMIVADSGGHVFGGHVGAGNVVRTTAEVLLIGLSEWHLSREADAGTGFKELVVRRHAGGKSAA